MGNIISSAALAVKKMPERKEVIQGLLPEAGLTLLFGRPKLGKSWMLLQLAIAVASGYKLFQKRSTIQKAVLYLALEDNEQRLKERQAMMLNGKGFPNNLYFATEWERHNKGGKEKL